MRILLLIIYYSLSSPRYFVEAHYHKLKSVIGVAMIPILMMTLTQVLMIYPQIQSFYKDVSKAETYIPTFAYQNDKLVISEGDKPLYFRSDNLQVVVDDTARTVPIFNTIPISREKFDKIKDFSGVSLFILRDQAFVKYQDFEAEIPDPAMNLVTSNQLKSTLQSVVSHQWLSLIPLLLFSFLFAFTYYWFANLICAIIVGGMNQFLNQKLKIKERLKIVVPITFIPIILTEFIKMWLPGFSLSILVLALYVMIIYYRAFISYTQFINELIISYENQPKEEYRELTDTPENRELVIKENNLRRKQEALKQEYLKAYEEFKSLDPKKKNARYRGLDKKLNKLKHQIVNIEINLHSTKSRIKGFNDQEEMRKKDPSEDKDANE